MRTYFWRAVAALMLLQAGAALGQQADPAAIIEAARERARKIEEMKAALNDPDATVRLAVLEAMLTSKDGLMRDIAFETGFSSTDAQVRSLTLRHAFAARDKILFDVSPPVEASADIKKLAQQQIDQGFVTFDLLINPETVDAQKGTFRTRHFEGTGVINGVLVTFDFGSWFGEVTLQDDNTLAGRVAQRGTNTFYLIRGRLTS